MKKTFKITFVLTILFFSVGQLNAVLAQDKKIEKLPPLYVIDGVQADSTFVINSINPSDIESVTVFKGEKAVSMYGSKGANGVLYIILKKDENAVIEQKAEEQKTKGIEESSINIFPNPTSEFVNITLNLKEKSVVEITIYNLQTLESYEISNEEYEAGEQKINWKADSLEDGTYTIKIKIGNQIIDKKIVIQK